MRYSLISVCAILLLALMATGCIGDNATPAQNSSLSNTTSAAANARITVLQTELDGLQIELQSAQNRSIWAEESNNWSVMQKEFKTTYELTTQMLPKYAEICQLQGKNCTSELEVIDKTLLCMNRTINVLDDMGVIYSGSQSLTNCSGSCPDNSETCISRCNSVIRDLKQVCTQLRTKTPDVRQVCVSQQSDSTVKSLDEMEQACRAISAMPYLRNDTTNLTDNSQDDLQILPQSNQTVLEPAISADAILDPKQGRYATKICSITASPDVISAGQETMIQVKGYASGGERITFTCGEGDPTAKGNGGLIDFAHLCLYEEEGPTTVWIALDGYVCASAPLDVDPQSSVFNTPSCRITANTRDVVRNGTKQTYSAAVRFRQQPTSANLSWSCAGEMFSKRLNELVTGDLLSGTVKVSCVFRDYSARDTPGRVFIDGVNCGDMNLE